MSKRPCTTVGTPCGAFFFCPSDRDARKPYRRAKPSEERKQTHPRQTDALAGVLVRSAVRSFPSVCVRFRTPAPPWSGGLVPSFERSPIRSPLPMRTGSFVRSSVSPSACSSSRPRSGLRTSPSVRAPVCGRVRPFVSASAGVRTDTSDRPRPRVRIRHARGRIRSHVRTHTRIGGTGPGCQHGGWVLLAKRSFKIFSKMC